MTIKIKKLHKDAKIPTRALKGDVGFDLYSIETIVILPGEHAMVETGIALEMPKGYYCEIHSRSGLRKKGVFPPVGIIDQNYRGSLGIILYNFSNKAITIYKGDRIAQLIFKQYIESIRFKEVKKLTKSVRGSKGFGSTGR